MARDRYRSHSFSLPESMLAAITDVAADRRQSKSSIVRGAVRAYLAGVGYPYPPVEESDENREPWPWQRA